MIQDEHESTERQKLQMKEAWDLIFNFFGNDILKTVLWFTTPNLNLGGCTPISLLVYSRGDKLLKFIRVSIEEDY